MNLGPRNMAIPIEVPESQHSVFIRGFPGDMEMNQIRDFFEVEGMPPFGGMPRGRGGMMRGGGFFTPRMPFPTRGRGFMGNFYSGFGGFYEPGKRGRTIPIEAQRSRSRSSTRSRSRSRRRGSRSSSGTKRSFSSRSRTRSRSRSRTLSKSRSKSKTPSLRTQSADDNRKSKSPPASYKRSSKKKLKESKKKKRKRKKRRRSEDSRSPGEISDATVGPKKRRPNPRSPSLHSDRESTSSRSTLSSLSSTVRRKSKSPEIIQAKQPSNTSSAEVQRKPETTMSEEKKRERRISDELQSTIADIVTGQEVLSLDKKAVKKKKKKLKAQEKDLKLSSVTREVMDGKQRRISGLSPEKLQELNGKRREVEQAFKQDCETFATVVKMLIVKDPSLEEKIMMSFRECLKEIGQKFLTELNHCIDSLTFNIE